MTSQGRFHSWMGLFFGSGAGRVFGCLRDGSRRARGAPSSRLRQSDRASRGPTSPAAGGDRIAAMEERVAIPRGARMPSPWPPSPRRSPSALRRRLPRDYPPSLEYCNCSSPTTCVSGSSHRWHLGTDDGTTDRVFRIRELSSQSGCSHRHWSMTASSSRWPQKWPDGRFPKVCEFIFDVSSGWR